MPTKTDKNKLKNTPISRGFGRVNFIDHEGDECSLQMSSLWEKESCIWLGANKAKFNGMKEGHPWQTVTEDDIKKLYGFRDFVGNTRMHLTQSQVKSLLPFLKKFAETGEF